MDAHFPSRELTLRVERIGARHIAGISREHTDNRSMPAQWADFSPWLGNVPGQRGADAYGVLNTSPDAGVLYLTGVEVADPDKLPDTLDRLVIAAGRYAVFECVLPLSEIERAWQLIWTAALPKAQLTPVAAPCFERYPPKFDPATGLGGFEIWLPLEIDSATAAS